MVLTHRVAWPHEQTRSDQFASHRIIITTARSPAGMSHATKRRGKPFISGTRPKKRPQTAPRSPSNYEFTRGTERVRTGACALSGQQTRRGPDRAQRRGPAIARGGPNHQHRHITKGARTHRIERRREGELSPTPRAMMTITLAANRGVRRARLERRGIGVSWNRGRWGPFRVLRARGRSASRNESGPSPRDWELGTEDGFWAWECWWRGGVRAVVSGAGVREEGWFTLLG